MEEIEKIYLEDGRTGERRIRTVKDEETGEVKVIHEISAEAERPKRSDGQCARIAEQERQDQ